MPDATGRDVLLIDALPFIFCMECYEELQRRWGHGKYVYLPVSKSAQVRLKYVPYKKSGRPRGVKKGAYGTAKLEDFIKRGKKNGTKKAKASLDANDMQGQAGPGVQRRDSADDSPGGEVSSGRHLDDIRMDREAVPLEVGEKDYGQGQFSTSSEIV
jgi:hypothetical protein